MTQRLHTFIHVREVLEKAGSFHKNASAVLSEWANTEINKSTQAFLQVVAEQEAQVANSLARALDGDIDLASAETYYQNPPENIPNADDLTALRPSLRDLEAFAAGLHELHQRWVEVYKALEATNPVARVDDLLRSCRELVEGLEMHLSSAQVQGEDT